LYASLNSASSRNIGSRIQDLILLCFHYRPITGRYGNIIMTTVRVLRVATVLGLLGLILRIARKEKVQAPSSRREETCADEGSRTTAMNAVAATTPGTAKTPRDAS